MEYKDYYAMLGVNKKASQDDIKHAYRRLARKYHPDVSKEHNAEEQFKNVQEAYEVLKDSEKRSAYDQLGSQWKAGQEFKTPPGWDAHTQFHGGRGHARDFSDSDVDGFSDFFSHIFGRAENFQQRGSDQHAKISVTLEEAFRGVTKTLQLQIPEREATGQIQHRIRTIKVNVPAGAASGQQLRLAQQGGAGMGGAQSGDLYLKIDIQPHPLFSLHGRDVFLTLPVTPWEAALGAEIKVPTLGGSVDLKLAAGSQAGQKLRLKGRGMPGKSGSGDQYAILQVVIPRAQTAEQKQLYEKMAQSMPFDPRKDWSA